MEKMKWYVFPKDILPMVLLSSQHPDALGGINVKNPRVNTESITLGYCDDIYYQGDYTPPSAIFLPEEKAAEIMAWLKVYAPDTYPLSQFARVLKPLELEIYDGNIAIKKKRKHEFYSHRWASVILGEILAQGESDVSLDTLPLSRSQATYSHAIARVNACHDGNKYKNLCLERLSFLEIDKNFVPRNLLIQDLEPIWNCVDFDLNDVSNMSDLIDIFSNIYFEASSALFEPNIRKELLSDSIESRVLSFRRISTEELNYNVTRKNNNAALKIAMAAFLVGRGTSHVFLLKSIAKNFPSVYVWFGLIAGIIGPTCWEVDWTRAVKGIEKSLRIKLDWSEPSQSDLSWTEYSWISKTFINKPPFVELPKLLPRVLSIEILPGVICQFRLAIESTSEKLKADSTNAAMYEINTLRMILSEFYVLAEKAKNQISEKRKGDDFDISNKRKDNYYINKRRK
ncbi:hypothetical protein DRW71_13285 [Salmonella enterica subsp. diarizonae]|nr:hypothetical protein [Salmonella enterica]EBV2374054.1 hypothetical protein [Salmonella enterica subsp. enterica serovar Enteritidis]ECC9190717.1 hypothetical protein [Salmonella enterica subsp. diarizonae]EGL0766046.1 hypothetical protein [Salmonella enterica subsp. enterica]EBE1333399.1 hypothetical protein [Salmonella enterica]